MALAVNSVSECGVPKLWYKVNKANHAKGVHCPEALGQHVLRNPCVANDAEPECMQGPLAASFFNRTKTSWNCIRLPVTKLWILSAVYTRCIRNIMYSKSSQYHHFCSQLLKWKVFQLTWFVNVCHIFWAIWLPAEELMWIRLASQMTWSEHEPFVYTRDCVTVTKSCIMPPRQRWSTLVLPIALCTVALDVLHSAGVVMVSWVKLSLQWQRSGRQWPSF